MLKVAFLLLFIWIFNFMLDLEVLVQFRSVSILHDAEIWASNEPAAQVNIVPDR